jgi:hypothetical protein
MVGVPVFVAAPVQMILSAIFWRTPGNVGFPQALVATLLYLLAIFALSITGIVFGLRGWLLATSERQPIALGLAGTILCTVTLLIWVGVAADLMAFFHQHMR